MSTGVLSIAPIVARLQATCPVFREVADAAGYAAIQSKALIFPAAYVIPLGRASGPNQYASAEIYQRVTARVGVVLTARAIRHDRGSTALSELEAAIDQVTAALLGWTAPGARQSFRHARGQLVSGIGAQGALVWQEDWVADLDMRSAP